MPIDSPWLWGPLAAAVYLAVSWFVGDVFPFSRYCMYSDTAGRSEGAVPIFLADGVETNVARFTRFVGIDPDGLYPMGLPCTMEWKLHEYRRWLQHNGGDEPGPVRVQFAFRVLEVGTDGSLRTEIKVVQEGTAWPTS